MPSVGSLPKNHKSADPVVVGGLTPLTTIDYPGQLAAVVFLQGCPWRCGYCQNGNLLARKTTAAIPWQTVAKFLERRRGLLDAVVFSGGEPTLHARLDQAMSQVRAMDYRVGLHTAGIYPDRLQKLLALVDWVGMDIKAAQSDYESITGVRGSAERAWRSARLLSQSGVAHEFRTTVHPDVLDAGRLASLVAELKAIGAKNYVIQDCVSRHCRDESLRRVSSKRLSRQSLYQFAGKFEHFSLRQV
jgi:pyruvate formate lyase activating enzyme